jgi:hypothetical protein
MHSFGFNWRRWEFWKGLISFRPLVIVSPVFLLTMKHWTNLVFLASFLGPTISVLVGESIAHSTAVNHIAN